MQFTMWFSGLRGAVAYALALNLVDNKEAFGEGDVVKVLDTTTLVIVLFTILVFGGSTLPLLKVRTCECVVKVVLHSNV